jgi:hypothetical protein
LKNNTENVGHWNKKYMKIGRKTIATVKEKERVSHDAGKGEL